MLDFHTKRRFEGATLVRVLNVFLDFICQQMKSNTSAGLLMKKDVCLFVCSLPLENLSATPPELFRSFRCSHRADSPHILWHYGTSSVTLVALSLSALCFFCLRCSTATEALRG